MRSLFEHDRLTLQESLALTAESLCEHGQRYAHWAIAYSGGKDSSAALTAAIHLIQSGRVPRPQSLTVLYADTRMELPPLQAAALATLQAIAPLGIDTRVVLPALDDRFMVYMLGRGVPPPKNRFRWCTSQLKIEPMLAALAELRARTGQKLLMLTGVRLGESAARDQRISLSCSANGAECGQGWFQQSTPDSIADTLAPILHWRVCHVIDWLMLDGCAIAPAVRDVARFYAGDQVEGSTLEIALRTGCVGCNLASRDAALDRALSLPEWSHLAPLKRLRPLYAELTEHRNRLRKANDERRADGSVVTNPGRIGPLTMQARRHGLKSVLAIQDEINGTGRPGITLIDGEERSRIEQLIDAGTWPQKWTGLEMAGDSELPQMHPDGSLQRLLFSAD